MSNNLLDMMCLDIYLSGFGQKEHKKINEPIVNPRNIPPLMCWEFFYPSHLLRIKKLKMEKDIGALRVLAKEFRWELDLHDILSRNPYDALVITQSDKKILWVNDGFSEMTGYAKSEAIKQTPTFLQGELTSEKAKIKIKNQVSQQIPFKEELINYRKDKTTYKCEINVFPLKGKNCVHFLALEREISY
ncbi:PAS domain-containing protein [Natronoflexus pectinivorans]|uniref:PAS domain S-box-containing protein n=1 Tax=Natronoflexus pectinivorans TaxID=682526 RepID=A0A4R2GE63_9BACT|nr:PAS domain-containing protein [Natronoflexus pectinivorans]TCO06032.1 PAS domain S-box-containing protein [Natronoflexus pectinivorans]